MPRLLALGHVTRDLRPGEATSGGAVLRPGEVTSGGAMLRPGEAVLGGTASYAALTACRLGWQAAVLTAAGPDFDAQRELPGVPVFLRRSPATTTFANEYLPDGTRRQRVTARAEDVDLELLPDEWRDPDVLLLGPVAGELSGVGATAFEAACVGAIAQGYVRRIASDGAVSPADWERPERDLLGVHVLFLSEHDLGDAASRARGLLSLVPIVALTRGWRGLTLLTRDAVHEVPSLPRPELDPTGAGDVFAAAFLVRYHETADPLEAAAFAACAASCAVEGPGASSLGDRAEVLRRMSERERFVEDAEWDEP